VTEGLRRYAVVTPVRNEAANLRTLADALAEQSLLPELWLIVDTGSTDGTSALVDELQAAYSWVRGLEERSPGAVTRGGPIVRAFHAGLRALDSDVDAVVKLDADITVEPDHFARLLEAFAADQRLGIAGGTCYERDTDGVWRQRHGTGPGVWGANRAYRRACLDEILPLEERMGWDTVDLIKATVRGWRTAVLDELPFRHHRVEGARDGKRTQTWAVQGRVSYFLGYRPSYVVLRTLYRALKEPAALALLRGYLDALLRREPRCADESVRRYVRHSQSLRELPARAAEARRPREELARTTVTRP
jgi:glycosyltransferase involved in cell wall biosynthesis